MSVPARVVVNLLCAAALTLGACATDQRADVETYRSLSDPPGSYVVPLAGSPLSLVDALQLTARYNEQISVGGELYIQALAARQRAAAALRPTLDLFSSTALNENTGDGPIDQTDAGVSGQYRLLTGLGDLRNVDAGDARIRSRRWLILDLRESLLLQTARAYYEVLRAERLIAVLEASVQSQLVRFEDAKARNEVGFTRPLDVAQIEAQVSRTRAQLISAVRQGAEARSTLALLTNADVSGSPLSDGFEASGDPGDESELWRVARTRRQDVLAARAEADAARLLVDGAISQFYPAVTLNLDYFLLRTPDDSPAAIAAMIEVRFPVFSAGRIEAEVRSAWSVFRQAVLEYRLRERECRRDIETASVQLRASLDRVIELRTQVRVAKQALALAEASYQAGLGTNLERITAQDQLLSAELEAASEEFTAKFASLALLRACGVLSSDRLGTTLPEPTEAERAPPDAPFLDRVGP